MTTSAPHKASIEGQTEGQIPNRACGQTAHRDQRDIKPRSEIDYDPEELMHDEEAEPNVEQTEVPPALLRLEAIIGRQGKITKSLESAIYHLKDSNWRNDNGLGPTPPLALEILDRVNFNFRQIQMAFLDRTFKEAKTAMRTVANICSEIEFDPVLAITIADHSGLIKVCQNVLARAKAAYIAKADEYALILGQTIPKRFKEIATAQVAKRKYFDGTNATARGDWDVFQSQLKDTTNGLPTGLAGLDDALGGGFSGLTILGANEGDGKTSLTLNMILSALRSDENLDCLFLTIDQSKKKTLERLYCLVTGCDKQVLKLRPEKRPSGLTRQINDGEAELQDSILPRMRFIEKSNLSVCEAISADTFVRYYQELKNITHVEYGILAIDMFQSLDRFPDSVTMENDKDEYRLNVIMRFIERTRSCSCPEGFSVIATSEVRKVDRERLTSNDLRGSARLGSLANNILLLWPPEGTNQYADVVPRTLNAAKSRAGDKSILQLQFHHRICRFTEMPTMASVPFARSDAGSNLRTAGLDSTSAL